MTDANIRSSLHVKILAQRKDFFGLFVSLFVCLRFHQHYVEVKALHSDIRFRGVLADSDSDANEKTNKKQ